MLVTNDIDNGTADIYEAVLGEGRIITLDPGQTIKSIAAQHRGRDLVIDFGGFVESRIIEAAGMADVTVVPLAYQSTADLMPAIKTVAVVTPYCANVALLINNTLVEHTEDLIGILASRFPKLPVLVINHSRLISRLADDGLTVFDLAQLSGRERYQLRNILPQVEQLYAFLDHARRD